MAVTIYYALIFCNRELIPNHLLLILSCWILTGVIGSDVPWLDCPACNAFNMCHNGHAITLYGVIMTLMEN